MIISHKHKFIFLKTRKTAGTSIEIALSRFCGEKDIITPISRPDERLREELSYRGPQNFDIIAPQNVREDKRSRSGRKAGYYNHAPAKHVKALIGTTIWEEYYKFCFERNPWDKALSLYYWQTRNCAPRPSLLEFLHHGKEQVPFRDRRIRLSNSHIYSIGGDLAVDHVGLYERLDSELERITTLLNLPERIELPTAKGTFREDRRHYREVMGHEERDQVAQACASEIALFGYSF